MAKCQNIEFDLRFAVGQPGGPRSSVWRAYSNKNEVYVSHGGLGGVQKFSFHSSTICRHAYTREEGPANGETDRVIQRWQRLPAPLTGIAYVLIARFPSDVLSTALDSERKTIKWLPAAAPGHATHVEFVFTALSEEAILAMAKSAGRSVVSYTTLPNGEAFVVSWVHAKWDREWFTFPGAFDREDSQYVISRHDPTSSGRPSRFTLFIDPTPEHPMLVDEFGAYSAPLDMKFDEPMGSFARNKVHKRGKNK